jgi:hypothetical protein
MADVAFLTDTVCNRLGELATKCRESVKPVSAWRHDLTSLGRQFNSLEIKRDPVQFDPLGVRARGVFILQTLMERAEVLDGIVYIVPLALELDDLVSNLLRLQLIFEITGAVDASAVEHFSNFAQGKA